MVCLVWFGARLFVDASFIRFLRRLLYIAWYFPAIGMLIRSRLDSFPSLLNSVYGRLVLAVYSLDAWALLFWTCLDAGVCRKRLMLCSQCCLTRSICADLAFRGQRLQKVAEDGSTRAWMPFRRHLELLE